MKKNVRNSVGVLLFGAVMMFGGVLFGKEVFSSSWGGTTVGQYSKHITLDYVGDSYQLAGSDWQLVGNSNDFVIDSSGVIKAIGEGRAKISYMVDGKKIFSEVVVDEFPDWDGYRLIDSNTSVIGTFDHAYDKERMMFVASSDDYTLDLTLMESEVKSAYLYLSDEEGNTVLNESLSDMQEGESSVHLSKQLELEKGKTYYIELYNNLYSEHLITYSLAITPAE